MSRFCKVMPLHRNIMNDKDFSLSPFNMTEVILKENDVVKGGIAWTGYDISSRMRCVM